MNVVITGNSGSGKTTAVRRMLKYIRQPLYGFWTEKLPAPETDEAPVYLHSFRLPVTFGQENRIGICREKHATSCPQVFDALGADILREIPEGSFVLLDEIGVMERDARVFQKELLRLLNGDYMVLLTVRDKQMPLLDAIRKHPKSICVCAAQANDEAYARQLAQNFRVCESTQGHG